MDTKSVVASNYYYVHLAGVMNKAELLAALKAKGVKNVEIERALGLPSSRVSEIMWAAPGNNPPSGRKARELTYDEGVKLARAFGLNGADVARPPGLPPEVLRLVARHVADSLGAEPSEGLLEDLTADLRAFAVFAADPKVRKTIDMAEGFFRGVNLRRQEAQEEAPQGSDPDPAH